MERMRRGFKGRGGGERGEIRRGVKGWEQMKWVRKEW